MGCHSTVKAIGPISARPFDLDQYNLRKVLALIVIATP
jgi:hypothetical protein